MIETTKITIENIDGEKLELTIEEAKALQKELNDMFGVEKEIEYRPINIPSIPTSPYVPWGLPYVPYTEPYITYAYKRSDTEPTLANFTYTDLTSEQV
jgi:hypothetical protein